MYNFDGCNFSDTTIQATTVIYFFTFYVLLPIYITVGLALHILLIVALRRQTKIKQTYGYQLQLAFTRTFYCVTYGSYLAGAYWGAGVGGSTVDWYVGSYWLMAFTMKVLPVLYNMAYFFSLFLSVVITCDRVYALAWPFRYKALNHRRTQSLVAAVLIAIACAMTGDKYFAYNIVEMAKNGTVFYQQQSNTGYVSAEWGRASEGVRVYVRGVCLIILMALNIAMIVLHRRRMRRIESMTISNEERIKARREINKDLTSLAVCQSILSCVDHVVNMFGQLLRQVSPYWAKCAFVTAPEVNSTMMLVGMVEFVLFVVVNRRLRMSIPGYKYLVILMRVNRVSATNGH